MSRISRDICRATLIRTVRTASGTPEQARAEMCERLRSRYSEIEQTILARVYAALDPDVADDPEYVTGLQTAVSAALDFGLAAIENGEERPVPVPLPVLAQARQAARSGVSLDVVLRRYFAGYTLLNDFVMQEVEDRGRPGVDTIHRFGRDQAAFFDRLLGAITDEYKREAEDRLGSAEERRAERVRHLLTGQLLDTSRLGYELDAWHLGALVAGPGTAEMIREVAAELDRRLLLVPAGEGTSWVWFGGHRRIDPAEVQELISAPWPASASLTVGEPAHGLAGWRLTHRQARAAMPVAMRGPNKLIRYADVALLSSVLQDDLLATSLRQLYLAPLSAERDGGETLRETLRAYFSAERNISSAAAVLGVSRRTVANRLQSTEARLGRPLGAALAEIEMALLLEEVTAEGSEIGVVKPAVRQSLPPGPRRF